MHTPRPIFIVGVHRSGTTLLRYMLNSSGRIYIPPESDFIPRFFLGKTAVSLTSAHLDNMLRIIFRYRFVREWQGPPPTAAELLAEMSSPTPAAFLDALYGRYARQHHAGRWGDKTPIYSSYMDLLAELFPQAQFIYLVRDGRDVALSMLQKWPNKPHFDMYFAACKWAQRTRQVQAAAQKLDDCRFYQLYYEELVQNPEHHLQKICQFLDEPYDPHMAQPHLLAQEQIQPGSFHDPVRQSPNTQKIGRWRQQMNLPDQRLFCHLAGDLLAHYGYPLPDLGPMPTAEKLRYAALAAKYTAFQTGRDLLQLAGVMPPN